MLLDRSYLDPVLNRVNLVDKMAMISNSQVICVNVGGGTPAERADEARHLLAADMAEPV